ncbi:hypothetical protein GINT2_000390 [Glugoides intestinalis]
MYQKCLKKCSLLFFFIIWSSLYFKLRRHILCLIFKFIDYLFDQPTGLKQNRVLMQVFTKIYKAILDQDTCFDITGSLKLCMFITFFVYRQTLIYLKELLDLLNNRSYNPMMKRYDMIVLRNDQLILSIVLFAVLLVIFANIIVIYWAFVAIYIVVELKDISCKALTLLNIKAANNLRLSSSKMLFTGFIKKMFTGEIKIWDVNK